MTTAVPVRPCQARNPDTCRYHSAVTRMQAAAYARDVEGFLAARAEAEAAKDIYDNPLLAFFTNEKRVRKAELATKPPLPLKIRAQDGTPVPARRIFHDVKPVEPQEWHGEDITNWILINPPEGTSNQMCDNCYHLYSTADLSTYNGSELNCSNCGQESTLDGVYLTPHSHHLLTNPEAVKEQTWYHITANPNWDGMLQQETAQDSILHVGSRFAAWMRGQEMKRSAHYRKDATPITKLYLYEVTIKPEATISPDTYMDAISEAGAETHWPTHTSRSEYFEGADLGTVHRYINCFEDPGSVSLFTKPRNLTSVKLVAEDPEHR